MEDPFLSGSAFGDTHIWWGWNVYGNITSQCEKSQSFDAQKKSAFRGVDPGRRGNRGS